MADAVWSNYPVSDVRRPGVQLGQMTGDQRSAAMALLKTLLSPEGYRKILDIMGSDQALADGGTNFASGKDVYTLAILGTPSTTDPWMSVGDLVAGPGKGGETIVPEGLKAPLMRPAQQELLLQLIGEWAGIIDPAYAGPRMAEIKAGLDETYFAWSGPTTHAPDQNGSHPITAFRAQRC
ncbi:MAG TPA: DUF3500 domain-containing protein [Paenirhodobacter sp.]